MTNLWEAYTGASDLKYRGIGKSQKRKIKSMFQHKDYVDDKTYKNDITLMRVILYFIYIYNCFFKSSN